MRLAICVPARNQCESQFANDLAELYAETKARVPAVMLNMVVGTFVHHGRERLLEEVIRLWSASHVLWLDSDMRFPPDAALRLLRHDVDFVACNPTTRVHPPQFVARREGRVIASGPDATGLEAVDSVGFGVVLMRTSIVETLPKPWFWYGSPTMTEDVYFCGLVRAAGREIFVDHDLSKEIGHIGQFTYRGIHVAPPLVHHGGGDA